MYGWRGILTGALALIIAQAVLERANSGGDQVGAVLGFVNELASRFIDPTVPAIPARTAAPLAPPESAFGGNVSSNPALNVFGLPKGTAPPSDTPIPPDVKKALGGI